MPKIGEHADSILFGPIDTEIVHLHVVNTLPGVLITFASPLNGEGSGSLKASGTLGDQLSWRAPGSSAYGSAVNCSVDGSYLLEDGANAGKFVRVTVYTHYLSTSGEANVYLQDYYNNEIAHDNITAAEAAGGVDENWNFEINNVGKKGISQLKFWVTSNADIYISNDGAGWVQPASESDPLALVYGNIPKGGVSTLYVRRNISGGKAYNPNVLTQLNCSFSV
jgi:hypothetical protein